MLCQSNEMNKGKSEALQNKQKKVKIYHQTNNNNCQIDRPWKNAETLYHNTLFFFNILRHSFYPNEIYQTLTQVKWSNCTQMLFHRSFIWV